MNLHGGSYRRYQYRVPGYWRYWRGTRTGRFREELRWQECLDSTSNTGPFWLKRRLQPRLLQPRSFTERTVSFLAAWVLFVCGGLLQSHSPSVAPFGVFVSELPGPGAPCTDVFCIFFFWFCRGCLDFVVPLLLKGYYNEK